MLFVSLITIVLMRGRMLLRFDLLRTPRKRISNISGLFLAEQWNKPKLRLV